MAATLGRISGSVLLRTSNGPAFNQINNLSTTREWSKNSRYIMKACLGLAAGGVGALIYALEHPIKAVEIVAHAPNYGWDFTGPLSSMDHASMRRGWEVYKNVCSACHSLKYVAFRHLINQTHTEEEAKAIAEEYQVQDGPDETGAMFMRMGKLSDFIPKPYPNEEAARAANNGANPPDLTFITNARHDGENYVFSLLTGYQDTPAGVNIGEGQSYNPYFPGGAIGMAQVIYDEVLEYEDGTPATASQIAKDVVSFLSFTANQEHDTRKRMWIKMMGLLSIALGVCYWMKRHKWTTIKHTKLAFVPKKKK